MKKLRDRKCSLYKFTFISILDLKNKIKKKKKERRHEPKKKVWKKKKQMNTETKKPNEV